MKRKTPRSAQRPNQERLPHKPLEAAQLPSVESEEPSDLEDIDPDDDRWDAFLADEDELDPIPELGDFWAQDD
jgi:hypothetical protein